MSPLDKAWHLCQTDDEIRTTDFELGLWRVFYGFMRWQQECERNVNGSNLTGQDLSVLHTIRMKERPKSITDIARLLNRDDTFNIQYSIRKLLKLHFIKKIKLPDSKSISYQMTELGIKNTDNMASARKKILIDMFMKTSNLNLAETTRTLVKLKAIYDQAEHAAASQVGFGSKNENEAIENE
jgi:predicted MarR family transcription regulator